MSFGFGAVPIGAVLDWDKNLTNTPPLPSEFIERNGQAIIDAKSPYNGVTPADLNGALGGSKRFIRGATVSKGVGGSDYHSHGICSLNTSGPSYVCSAQSPSGSPWSYAGQTHTHTVSGSTLSTDTTPSFYECVKVMRIK